MVGGQSRQAEGSGTVCATHTHHIATPNTESAADRETTTGVISGKADSSGQTDSSEQTEFRADRVQTKAGEEGVCLHIQYIHNTVH